MKQLKLFSSCLPAESVSDAINKEAVSILVVLEEIATTEPSISRSKNITKNLASQKN